MTLLEDLSPLAQKLIETGVVSRHVAALMERWGSLPEGTADLAARQQFTKQTEEDLLVFALEIESMLEDADVMKSETPLS